MTTSLPPKRISSIFNSKDFERTNEDVIMSINELNYKYEQHINELTTQINELKTQINKLTCLVQDLQKINIKVDDKTTEISNGILQIIENTNEL
jgi:uncharacterized phage infection (PIP) family protein YhgE